LAKYNQRSDSSNFDGLIESTPISADEQSPSTIPPSSKGKVDPSNRRQIESDSENAVGLLDPTNKKIITLLEHESTMSQIEIARRLGLSQSSIALRLEKLRRSGLLSESIGINPRSIGLQMCRVDLACDNAEEAMEWAKTCPLFVNGSVAVGGVNLSLFFVAEDYEMFQMIVDQHVRRLPGVTGLHFSPIVSWASGLIVSVPLSIERKDDPPCNMLPYCTRCPANPDYDGKIWNGTKRKR